MKLVVADTAPHVSGMYDSDDWKMPRRRRQPQSDPQPGRLEGKAPVKAAVLGVLLEAPGHGYDVAKRLNQRMGTWILNPKHIYEPLKQLERAKLVRSQREPSPDPPGFRTIYYPTDAARGARDAWFGSPPALSVLRADIHARLAYSTPEDAPALVRSLHEYRADLIEAIQDNAVTWAAPKGSWLGFVIEHLRAEVDKQCEAEIEWANKLRADLEERISGRPPR
jgi:DNA-binding PadR family transcriptional regulator